MEKIFFILFFCVVAKFLLSVILICKKLKNWSYVTEIAFSCIMFCVALNLNYDWYFVLLTIIGEYLLSKILIYINIILIKKISFRLLIWNIDEEDSKFCHKLKRLYRIDYGRNLKHGLPTMANKVHETTGIRFDRNGFPRFKSYYTVKLNRKDFKESRETHFYKANRILYKKALKSKRIRKRFTRSDLRALKKGETPQHYTWHHHQDNGKLQLVSREIHSLVNHIGGYSIWGADE